MEKNWDPRFGLSDLSGKVAVVTGGNAGIGLQTVKHLAANGAKVYFTARSEAKAKRAKDYVVSQDPSISIDRLIWLPLDLSDIPSIAQAIESLKKQESKIDILVNNAGVATEKLEKSNAGWEMTLAVCHVGHFIFTNGLFPLLKAAALDKNSDVRVVTVSSSAAISFLPSSYPFNFTSPSFLYEEAPHAPWQYNLMKPMFAVDVLRYSIAKAANMVFAKELQRRCSQQGIRITSISVNPGAVKSDGGVGVWSGIMKPIMRRAMIGEEQGSYALLFAAASKEVQQNLARYQGKFLEPIGRVTPAHAVVEDEKQVQGLWENTTKEANSYLAKHQLELLVEW